MPVAHVGLITQGAALAGLMAMQQQNVAPNGLYRRARAKIRASEGDKLIERMAFWGEIPLIGARKASKLADELERLTDSIEKDLELV